MGLVQRNRLGAGTQMIAFIALVTLGESTLAGEFENGLIYVPVSINSQRGYALIDTGAYLSTVSDSVSKTEAGYRIKLSNGTSFKTQNLRPAAGLPTRWNGQKALAILGLDWLGQRTLKIDYEQLKVDVFDRVGKIDQHLIKKLTKQGLKYRAEDGFYVNVKIRGQNLEWNLDTGSDVCWILRSSDVNTIYTSAVESNVANEISAFTIGQVNVSNIKATVPLGISSEHDGVFSPYSFGIKQLVIDTAGKTVYFNLADAATRIARSLSTVFAITLDKDGQIPGRTAFRSAFSETGSLASVGDLSFRKLGLLWGSVAKSNDPAREALVLLPKLRASRISVLSSDNSIDSRIGRLGSKSPDGPPPFPANGGRIWQWVSYSGWRGQSSEIVK